MLTRFAFVMAALIMCAGLLLAHGDPIMGTVTAVTNDSFTIKDKTDKPIVIMLEKSTKFMRADKPVKKEEPEKGKTLAWYLANYSTRAQAVHVWLESKKELEVPKWGAHKGNIDQEAVKRVIDYLQAELEKEREK